MGGGIACLYFVNKATNRLDFELAGYVAGGALGVVVSLFLLWDVSAPNASLGVLQEEKSLLVGALFVVFFTGAAQIAKPFRETSDSPVDDQHTAWIIDTWTWGPNDGDCTPQVTIQRGGDRELVFVYEDERIPHRIEGDPSANAINTDYGTYTLQGGEMTSTARGNEARRFIRCRR